MNFKNIQILKMEDLFYRAILAMLAASILPFIIK